MGGVVVISARDVSKSFLLGGHENVLLSHINFELLKGETLAILGKSGSGKSTLLSMIGALQKPTAGEILVHGKNFWQLNDRDQWLFRCRSVAMIFQTPQLVSSLTAMENIEIPLQFQGVSHPKETALHWLEKVGLGTRGHHLPRELSGGEAQRVSIARAMAMNTKVILADEPNSSLDTETGKMVMDLFFDLVNEKQQTLILVTHDDVLAKKCQQVKKLTHQGLG
jgi:putative ABC transport system ATP-binding protein